MIKDKRKWKLIADQVRESRQLLERWPVIFEVISLDGNVIDRGKYVGKKGKLKKILLNQKSDLKRNFLRLVLIFQLTHLHFFPPYNYSAIVVYGKKAF